MASPRESERRELLTLARLFLRLGTTAFGGPAVHIAMMQDEVVTRRGWLSPTEFLDRVAACNLIPGPNSTELALHIGHLRAGWRGLLVAGACFILPAAFLTGGIAWMYVRAGTIPEARTVLWGVKPVVLAVVVQALIALAPKAAPTLPLRVLGVASVLAVVAGVDELAVLAAAGIVAMLGRRAAKAAALFVGMRRAAAGAVVGAVGATMPAGATLPRIFLFFAKVGSVLFGSGYVLLAFLRADLVERLRWLTEGQLLDAIAVGQLTPGPVFTTATFIGYLLAGAPGAVVATAGIFLPAFVFVAISGPLVPRLRRSPRAGAFLDGVNVASLALLGVVAVQLGVAAITGVPAALLAVASFVLLVRWRVNSAWLVVAGAALGPLIDRMAPGALGN
jgi:chromate transporter